MGRVNRTERGFPKLKFICSGRLNGTDGSFLGIHGVFRLSYIAERYITIITAIEEEIKRLQVLRAAHPDMLDPDRVWIDTQIIVLVSWKKRLLGAFS